MVPIIWIDSSGKASSGSFGRSRSFSMRPLLAVGLSLRWATSMRCGRNGSIWPSAVYGTGSVGLGTASVAAPARDALVGFDLRQRIDAAAEVLGELPELLLEVAVLVAAAGGERERRHEYKVL